MNNAAHRVADVFRKQWDTYRRDRRIPSFQDKAIRHIMMCRTGELGAHRWRCPDCGKETLLCNSCRDRHCPTCQGEHRERWIQKRLREVLPVPYFHLVFTLPHKLNPLIRHNRKALLDLFFKEVNATLQEFARDPQWRLEGQLGFIAVLHTWTQTLCEHYHLHCAAPGGVWRSKEQQWISTRRNWLFKDRALADRFRNRYLKAVGKLLEKGALALPEDDTDWKALLNSLSRKDWIVYAKQPFAGPAQVLEYLGRYTHKVAISDYRIVSMDEDTVTFRYRDRADNDTEKQMTLGLNEFIRRFLQHILPEGFQKIRFYGWMARNVRTANLRIIRKALNIPLPEPKSNERPAGPLCPHCGKATMQLIGLALPEELKPP